MSALMSDAIEGTLGPGVVNATVNAGGKLLKAVELQMKYGVSVRGKRVLTLVGDAQFNEAAHTQNGHRSAIESRA